MPAIETALTRLDIQHPILTAPMTGTAGDAVSHAGGLGIVAPGPDEAVIRCEVAAAGNARVGIGFITGTLARNAAALDVARDAGPVAVMLSFGASISFCPRIRAAGCKIICQVQPLAMARETADAGADILITQGRDAGGHGGAARGTFDWCPPWWTRFHRSRSSPPAASRMGATSTRHWRSGRPTPRWARASPRPEGRCGPMRARPS